MGSTCSVLRREWPLFLFEADCKRQDLLLREFTELSGHGHASSHPARALDGVHAGTLASPDAGDQDDGSALPPRARTEKPRSRHPWMPPRSGRTCLTPRRSRVSAARALLASLGQLQ